MTVTAATAINAAINPYSIAVAPDSSQKARRIKVNVRLTQKLTLSYFALSAFIIVALLGKFASAARIVSYNTRSQIYKSKETTNFELVPRIHGKSTLISGFGSVGVDRDSRNACSPATRHDINRQRCPSFS